MNFPDTQKTGALAEINVEALFIQWGWATGRDRIDVGYDLCVQPDKAMFKGHRFLVQVKGTASKKKGGVVAPVSKARLRDYHINPTPVFIVRSTQDGSLYWVHAQEWTNANKHRLQGDGNASVKLPPANVLVDRESFTKKLSDLFAPLATKSESLVDLATDRGAYLSTIDPRFDVRVGTDGGNTTYHFSARGEDVEVPLEITPADAIGGLQSLTDGVRFGLPFSVDVSQFRVTGSPVFSELGMDVHSPAKLEMEPAVERRGAVGLHPGDKFDLLATEVHFPASLYFGSEGAAIRSSGEDSPLRLEIRSLRNPGRGFQTSITIGLHEELFRNRALRTITVLPQVGKWAEESLRARGFHLTATFSGKQVATWCRQNLAPEQQRLLYFLNVIGKLHQVARALNSDIELEPDIDFSRSDLAAIRIAYKLLKGERLRISPKDFAMDSDESSGVEPAAAHHVRTTVSVVYADKCVGKMPVSLELRDYRAEYDPVLRQQRFYPEENSAAYIQFDEGGVAT